jgi:hypothetical protein
MSRSTNDDQLTLYFPSLIYSPHMMSSLNRSFTLPSSDISRAGEFSLREYSINVILYFQKTKMFLFLESELLFYKDDMAVKNGRSSSE